MIKIGFFFKKLICLRVKRMAKKQEIKNKLNKKNQNLAKKKKKNLDKMALKNQI